MQYLLMICANEAEHEKIVAATGNKMYEEYGAFTQGIIQSGNFKAGDRLRPVDTATTVRVRDGKIMTTDGPYLEGKEHVGGLTIMESADLDEVLKWARRAATVCGVVMPFEVREIFFVPAPEQS